MAGTGFVLQELVSAVAGSVAAAVGVGVACASLTCPSSNREGCPIGRRTRPIDLYAHARSVMARMDTDEIEKT